MPLIRKPANAGASVEANPAFDVVKALTSNNSDERWTAARMAVGDPRAESTLASLVLTESDPRVREAMLTSLTRSGSSESIDAIVSLLRSDDAASRAGALDALRPMTDVIRARLPSLLSDSDADVRLLSCELARSLPGEEATRLLSDLLRKEREPNVCAAAIDVLAEAGRPEALTTLDDCEIRFKDTPFLSFAIKIAKQRIQSQSPARHG